jgi:DNA-binding transcriptional LysR family regulator
MVAGGYGVAILPEVLVTAANSGYKFRPLRAPVPPFALKLLWLRKAPSLVLQNFLAVARTSEAAPTSSDTRRRKARGRTP